MNEIDCRRSQVLEYFGEKFPSEKCKNTCDNCRRGSGMVSWLDVTEHAVAILRLVTTLIEAKLPKFTINMLRTLLSGSKDKKLERYRALLERMGMSSEITDSRGKSFSKPVCEKILHGMVVSDYLREDSEMTASSFTAEYVSVGTQADALLSGLGKLTICIHSSKRKTSSTSVTDEIEEEELPLSGDIHIPSQTLSSKSNSPDPKYISKSRATLPSKKPWEANKSGKLALKKSSETKIVKQINLTESDDEFEESMSKKRQSRSTANLVQLDNGVDDEMSPEIMVKRHQSSKSRILEDIGEEYIMSVKQRSALRSWLNEYRKRFVAALISHRNI